jgi:hypothetical protein
MNALKRKTALLPLACVLLLAPAALFPETILLCVTETVNGEPSPQPLPASEGIWSGLFESGHIIFNTRDGKPAPPLETLVELAVSGGAGYILDTRVAFVRTPREDGLTMISAKAEYSLILAKTGKAIGKGIVSGDNKVREKEVDLAALGMELGKRVAEKASALLAQRGPKR